ncbi:MAG: type II toxin-antitoxin system VapC family toxin [Acidobacteria bacterium]|nr:type II toxin-antitoxin system VapC family toxin [Acidobacteriota bacterium]
MYLADTNIWLERLLGQAKSDEVGQFLDQTPSNQIFITDFAFHSICVILTRLQRKSILLDFVRDVFVDGAVSLISIKPEETQSLVDAMDKYNLDFDDAYQYVAAEQNNLAIVSFDNDLDRTLKGKKTPAEILAINKEGAVE